MVLLKVNWINTRILASLLYEWDKDKPKG